MSLRTRNNNYTVTTQKYRECRGVLENGEKRSDLTISDERQPNLSVSDFPTMLVKNVYDALKLNRKAKYYQLADNVGVSEATIKRAIADLKGLGYINPEHSKIKGEWQLLK